MHIKNQYKERESFRFPLFLLVIAVLTVFRRILVAVLILVLILVLLRFILRIPCFVCVILRHMHTS